MTPPEDPAAPVIDIPYREAEWPAAEPIPITRKHYWPDPGDSIAVGTRFFRDWQCPDGRPALREWRGSWWYWTGPQWVELGQASVCRMLFEAVAGQQYRDDNGKPRNWKATRSRALDALACADYLVTLPEKLTPPFWIADDVSDMVRPDELIACRNTLVHTPTRRPVPHTSKLFNITSSPFDYEPRGADPIEWSRFLHAIWPDDPAAIAALQEWFGYVLSGRRDLHKMLLVVGPTRSGKGTLARVMTALAGPGNVIGPTLASLATNFGLAPLMDKSLAIVADARLERKDGGAVAEQLLAISGEDMRTIDRKHRDAWSGTLPTRVVILSNELPQFRDASTAIVGRFLTLMMHESFYGREDLDLTGKLLDELPAILHWALTGLDRLRLTRRFTRVESGESAMREMEDAASPVRAFVRDRCVIDKVAAVDRPDIWAAWKEWAEEAGHAVGNAATLGRALSSVVPHLQHFRPVIGGRQVRQYLGLRLLPGGAF